MLVKKAYLLLLLFLAGEGQAQAPAQLLKMQVKVQPAADSFYRQLDYALCWTAPDHKQLAVLYSQLLDAESYGLDAGDYEHAYLQKFIAGRIVLPALQDTIEADIRITATALHFYHDLAFGNTVPPLGYSNWRPVVTPGFTALAAQYYNAGRLAGLPAALQPDLPEIAVLLKKIAWVRDRLCDSAYRDLVVPAIFTTVPGRSLLLQRLQQLGFGAGPNADSAIRAAKREVGLSVNTLLTNTFIAELNCPLRIRLQQLKLALNYYRWVNAGINGDMLVLVNIPATVLKVYKGGQQVLGMKIVAGEPGKPTPALASSITEAILYPYWHVPRKIATRELLPAIKRNPGYIDAHNYQVLDREGNIVAPGRVNWKALSERNFPYLLRQSTGCDNALGLVKFNFYNPYNVYLHDTPLKFAFGLDRRFLSHGCMRVEKPMELGHLLLRGNAIAIDTLTQKGCLRNQSPTSVPLPQPVPVLVWYNPAGIDEAGRLQFYPDVYNRFKWNTN